MNYRYHLRGLFWYYRKFINRKLYKKSQIFWKENKNRYEGRRGFVIGNGPSLLMSDLDLLMNDITIASNKIYLAFSKTEWRPTFYTIADLLLWKKIRNELFNHIEEVVIAHTLIPINTQENMIMFRSVGSYRNGDYSEDFSYNVGEKAFGNRTITYFNLQIAVHLGLNPIYLIGCDHYYNESSPSSSNSTVVSHTGQRNHFIDNYRTEGELVNFAPIDIMTQGYVKAKEMCTKKNISIYNATRGGYLEVFDRVSIDELFNYEIS